MDASLNLNSSIRLALPYTTGLLPEAEDKTWIKVAKVALTILCACTIVLPLITLLADGIHHLYHNLTTQKISPLPVPVKSDIQPPPAAPIPVELAPDPAPLPQPVEITPQPVAKEPSSPISRIAIAAAGLGLAGAAAAAYVYSGGAAAPVLANAGAVQAVAANALAVVSPSINPVVASAAVFASTMPAAAFDLTSRAMAHIAPSVSHAKANISSTLHELKNNVTSAVFRSDAQPTTPRPSHSPFQSPVQPPTSAPQTPIPEPKTPRRDHSPFQSSFQPPASAPVNGTQSTPDEAGLNGLSFFAFGLGAAALAAAGGRGPQQPPEINPENVPLPDSPPPTPPRTPRQNLFREPQQPPEVHQEPPVIPIAEISIPIRPQTPPRTPRQNLLRELQQPLQVNPEDVPLPDSPPATPTRTPRKNLFLQRPNRITISRDDDEKHHSPLLTPTPQRTPRQITLITPPFVDLDASPISPQSPLLHPTTRRRSDPNLQFRSFSSDDSKQSSPPSSPLLSSSRSRRLSESHDGFQLVEHSVDSFTPAQRIAPSTLETISSNLASILFDPGNPEKGKKYHYALHAAQETLNRHRDLDTVLEMLAEAATAENLDPVAHYRGAVKLRNPNFPVDAFCAISALTNFEGYPSIRSQYAHHLIHLRDALSNPAKEQFPRAKQILEDLCHTKYTGVYMYPHLENFVLKALSAPQSSLYHLPILTLENLATSIGQANERLITVPPAFRKRLIAKEFEKFQGTVGLGFDPTATANTPWVHSKVSFSHEQNEAREIAILRHGTPTIDPSFFGLLGREAANMVGKIPGLSGVAEVIRDYSSRAEVIPEYKGFLNSGKRVLYVNHQESDDQEIHGEADRSRAIQALEQTYPNFHYLALPMDGHLWEKNNLTPAQFKHDVLTALKERREGFALPAAYQEIDAEELWEKVQALYFNNQEPNSLQEKQDFLMIFYSYLKTSLMIRLNVSYMNASCKDDKDRGNASKLVDQMIRAVQTNTETDPTVLGEIFFSALAPFIIKNEAIIPKRLNLALNVFNRIANLTPEQRERIRSDLVEGYKIVRQEIPKEKANWSSVVKNPKDFLALIRQMQTDEEEDIVPVPQFQELIASTYHQDSYWNLERLKTQIMRDLPRTDIRVNGQRMTEFDPLVASLGLSELPFHEKHFDARSLRSRQRKSLNVLSMLHQGMVGPITVKITESFVGNPLGMLVRQTPLKAGSYPTIIRADSHSRSISATQYLELAFPNEESAPIPLEANVRVNNEGQASMRWRFLPSQQK